MLYCNCFSLTLAILVLMFLVPLRYASMTSNCFPLTPSTIIPLPAPFGIPHGVDRSFELAGYTIPRDAVVFSNITAIHNDPNIFPNPEIFDPSRWLDKNGDITGRDRLLSFSLGQSVLLLLLLVMVMMVVMMVVDRKHATLSK